ncbi:hypothetical protein DPMN_165846 [Dreissena polymorpha]|uniref:Uncharacterized protein n=1 Tax=Dreissena polymorpha TaxID=45954 RepID=A0A9D4EVR2_DREPO|nr:hypothetical protein DPMN_165846 [Dreissena polymorpha]
MQLNKLIAMRDGHRRLISRELERFDSTELTTSEYERLLHMIVEEAEEVRTLNDKIVNHNDIEDLSSELVEGKSYSFDLELKIQRLRDNRNKRIGNKEEITSNVSQDIYQNRKQPDYTVHSIPVVNNAPYLAQQLLTQATPAAPLTYKLPRDKYHAIGKHVMGNSAIILPRPDVLLGVDNATNEMCTNSRTRNTQSEKKTQTDAVNRSNYKKDTLTHRRVFLVQKGSHAGNQEDNLMEAVQESGSDDSGRKDVSFTLGGNSQEESTMISTLIIPDRTIPCSQRMPFKSDNEPVFNSAPEVDESGDTFHKRLQRSKLQSPNDSCMPSGHEFCFEAVVNKRYNRWKRRRRKKNSKHRQPVVVPGSGSSDENDERNSVIERIIDTMYEQIHGPVPHTPNGSSDTQRTGNCRSWEKESSTNIVSGDDGDVDPSSGNYDASSSSLSTDALRVTYDNIRHISDGSVYSPQGYRVRPEASDSGATSEDMCAWSHIEQYKHEIRMRLKYTPEEVVKVK